MPRTRETLGGQNLTLCRSIPVYKMAQGEQDCPARTRLPSENKIAQREQDCPGRTRLPSSRRNNGSPVIEEALKWKEMKKKKNYFIYINCCYYNIM